ncbi:MAG: GLPGLI family protein [Pedobacter sp.]|nr:MAG: GLPGLI family protein [Pedobacter sp.]
MKKIILTAFLLCAFNLTFAQQRDSINYEVVFKVARLNPDSSAPPSEMKILFISNAYALEKNYDRLKLSYPSHMQALEARAQEKGTGISPKDLVKEKSLAIAPSGQLLYDLKRSSVKFFHSGRDWIYYERPLEKFEWKITEDKVKIANYICQKAIGTTAKGDKWEVWFTKDIQPYTGLGGMTGLPGFILKGSGGPNQLIFEATEVYKGSRYFTYLEKQGNMFREVTKEAFDEERENYRKEIEEARKKIAKGEAVILKH